MMGGSVQFFPVERIENEKLDLPAVGEKRKYQISVPDLAADRKKEKKKESITVEELRMKTERELRAERREKRAREYMQVDVRIENEKIDLPADRKKEKKKKKSITGEELRMKTDRELRAERRERARQECQNKYKGCIKGLPVENNKIDSSDSDLFVPVLPVYTGEELDEIKANYLKVKGMRIPWKTKYRAGMNDKKQWPPIWRKKFKESPEYFAVEDFLRNRRSDNCYKLLCKEIRNSRGYDIPHVDREYISKEFHEMHHSENSEKCIAVAACKYVTDQINERAKDHGESYVFDEVKKLVRWRFPYVHYWYTFTVKQERPTCGNIKTVQAFAYCRPLRKLLVFLKEWRFKP